MTSLIKNGKDEGLMTEIAELRAKKMRSWRKLLKATFSVIHIFVKRKTIRLVTL